jgi:cytidine deaminase
MNALAIAAAQDGRLIPNPVAPCGACRQVMAQYQLKSGCPMKIFLIGAEKIHEFDKVEALLPFIFDSI